MERKKLRIPDAINCSKPNEFTLIPNDLIRNPNISGRSKALLCLLLSNSNGWYSYITVIETMMQEGKTAIRSSLVELENLGYLKRIRYRNKHTKILSGSFWAYTDTPFRFDYENHLNLLETSGFEPVPSTSGQPTCGQSATKNNNRIYIKGQKLKKQKPTIEERHIIPPTIEMIKIYCTQIKSQIDPETFFNWNTAKGWMIGKNKMVDWHAALSTWEKRDKKNKKEVNKPKFKFRDQFLVGENGITYKLGEDGRYHHQRTGEIYFE
jgi:hypothetical protein